jgi:nitrate reductase NapE component
MFARITEDEIRSKKFVVLAFCLVAIHVSRIAAVGHFVAGMFQVVISA